MQVEKAGYNVNMETQLERRQAERTVRPILLKEQGQETGLDATTPAKRIAMMWPLALDAWAFLGDPAAEPRLLRHTIRILR